MKSLLSHYSPQRKSRRGQKKLKFTDEDDKRLAKYVAMIGDNDWSKIATLMGDRNGRQCRERWNNYANPNLRTDPWMPDEIQLLCRKYQELGPKWNRIAKFFKNRSTNSIKNKWMSIKSKEQALQYDFRVMDHPPISNQTNIIYNNPILLTPMPNEIRNPPVPHPPIILPNTENPGTSTIPTIGNAPIFINHPMQTHFDKAQEVQKAKHITFPPLVTILPEQTSFYPVILPGTNNPRV